MIKNLIFDVGNVLLSYRWVEMMVDFGMTKEESIEFGTAVFENKLWKEFDLGNIEDERLCEQFSAQYPQYAEAIRYFVTHPEVMPIARPRVWEKVSELKQKGYKIYILSNYPKKLSEAHYPLLPFYNELDGCVVSSKIHMGKPGLKIYRYLLDTYNLWAEECVFFDDRIENVDAANQIGIHGMHVLDEEHLLELLNQF